MISVPYVKLYFSFQQAVRAKVYVRKRNKAEATNSATVGITSVKDPRVTAVNPQKEEQATVNHLPTVEAVGLQLSEEWRRHCEKRVGISAMGKKEKGKRILAA